IDQPRLDHCIPPTEHVMGLLAYVRLHGRNHARWWQHDHPNQRYDYLYTEAELDSWTARIRNIDQQAGQTFVFTNNHFRGQAPANAIELQVKLSGQQVDIPDGMLIEFPRLRKYARPSTHERQGELF